MKSLFKPRFSLFFLIEMVLCFMFIIAVGFISYRRKISDYKGSLLATYQSPLPGIAIAETAEKPFKTKDVFKKNYNFTIDWFTPKIPVWQKIFESYKGKPNLNYLEIGSFEGRSLIWMLENILTDPNSKAAAVDIFWQEDYEKRYQDNLKLSGFSDKVTTIKNYSQLAMRNMPFESFDIVNIDGSHKKNDVLEDAVLAWRLVKPGGLLLLDDYRYAKKIGDERLEFCKNAIDAFALCFDEYFEVIHNGKQLILRRKSP